MRNSIQKTASNLFALWKDRVSLDSKKRVDSAAPSEDAISDPFPHDSSLELSGPNRSATPLKFPVQNERGFALVFLISLLPILIAAGLFLLFSQYLVKNWMQSVHICRSELLMTQKKVSQDLSTLMDLNPAARALRVALLLAQAELAAALASFNPELAAKATADIARILRQQRQLDQAQKFLIAKANLSMFAGAQKVRLQLQAQDRTNKVLLPEFFSFRLHSIRTQVPRLAVQPDRPSLAPVYELKKGFEQAQALSVSWISQFQTQVSEASQWISQNHQKKDSCSGSLKESGKRFVPILTTTDRFF